MPKQTQISALISKTTRILLEKHVRATGVKKGHLVEQALLHHMQALEELPVDFIIHPRVVVSRKVGEALLQQLKSAKPTPALRRLMRDEITAASGVKIQAKKMGMVRKSACMHVRPRPLF